MNAAFFISVKFAAVIGRRRSGKSRDRNQVSKQRQAFGGRDV
jgi:hypothetical protein